MKCSRILLVLCLLAAGCESSPSDPEPPLTHGDIIVPVDLDVPEPLVAVFRDSLLIGLSPPSRQGQSRKVGDQSVVQFEQMPFSDTLCRNGRHLGYQVLVYREPFIPGWARDMNAANARPYCMDHVTHPTTAPKIEVRMFSVISNFGGPISGCYYDTALNCHRDSWSFHLDVDDDGAIQSGQSKIWLIDRITYRSEVADSAVSITGSYEHPHVRLTVEMAKSGVCHFEAELIDTPRLYNGWLSEWERDTDLPGRIDCPDAAVPFGYQGNWKQG